MNSAEPHAAVILASGTNATSVEAGIVGFAVLMLILLVVVRARRSHDQKLRRAASSGFYDFDAARYGRSATRTSLTETPIAHGDRPLAPSFVSPSRGGGRRGKEAADRVAPMPVPSPFVADRAFVDPLPAFDPATALGRPAEGQLPVPQDPPDREPSGAGPPIPSSPNLPPTGASPPPPGEPPPPEPDEGVASSAPAPPPAPAPESSLPFLVQPPPPDPGSD